MSAGSNSLGPRKAGMSQNGPVKRRRKCGTENLKKKLKGETSKVHYEGDYCAKGVKDVAEKSLKGIKFKKVQKKSEAEVKANKQKKGTKREEFPDSGKQVPHAQGPENSKVTELLCVWKDEDYLADSENLPVPIARNIIGLIDQEYTIPFIARYRGHLTGELSPDKLRKVRETYLYIQKVHEQARKLHKQLSAAELLTPELLSFIQAASTLEELDFIGSGLKKGGKRTLADRARQLGLESPAKQILEGKQIISLERFVVADVADLNQVDKVRLGVQHVIADLISKTAEVHSELEKIYSSKLIMVNSTMKKRESEEASSKYELYGNFSRPLHTVKPYQILAINRGESEKELSVKILIPDSLWVPLKSFCKRKWLGTGVEYKLRTTLFTNSVNDAIKRLRSVVISVGPLAVRQLRAKLNSEAENEALSVFGHNLRQLLMTPPCSGHVVMGIDPGFASGCKVAVVSHNGNLLYDDKFFLKDPVTAEEKLKSLILRFRCEVIALGNGTACRETETLLTKVINSRLLKPLRVSYTITSEQGVSIYSCSPLAREEFPELSPTVVGAISLARRLQNPLSELVKVEAKHLGVGMYQHDVNEKKLVTTLDEIVSECVSFVGVDVNSASFYLLKRVAGLKASTAQEIINYRSKVCSFKCREDLKKVKGIKTETFRQCSGFLRVIPSTARCTKHKNCQEKFNPLDETCIHPESYETAYKILQLLGGNLDDLGSKHFAETVRRSQFTPAELAKRCDSSELCVSFIMDVFTKPKNFDLRTLFSGPIFRAKIKKLEDLAPGQRLKGIVRNVVSFGAFVDIGVGRDGLIHTCQMGNSVLHLNSRVDVQVLSVDKISQRIQLKLISLMESNAF